MELMGVKDGTNVFALHFQIVRLRIRGVLWLIPKEDDHNASRITI